MISGSSVATGASSAARCGEAPMATPSVSIWLTNMRRAGDHHQRQHRLRDGPGQRGIRVAGTQQRLQVFTGQAFLVIAQLALHVEAVGDQEQDAQPGFQAKASSPSPTLKTKMPMNQAWSRACLRWSALIQSNCVARPRWARTQADDRVGQRRQYQRTAHRGAHADVLLLWGIAEHDDGHHVTALSGSAVPKAASTVPVAVAPSSNRWPTHSTPLTKYSQAK